MLSGFAKFLLALTALSPVALTWAIADYSRNGFNRDQLFTISISIFLAIGCAVLLRVSGKKLTKVTFTVEELKAVDNEVVAYIVTYLFPLVAPATDISLLAQGFVLALLALVLSTSNAFTFNPVLSLLGYHFYEVKCTSGVSYLLLSRNDITDVRVVKKVGRLSRHLMLDLS
ncbi:hypothetical protein [Pandoraea sp. ISTKB]|uniref:hypothetical protein n=1 Tax=Pandoraea sp. ISTKB TaxID=1586708 RepID=UPI00084730B9|nr:hypothetical protein [Pandoraea sp. ISTKB]ODP31558.1 hypothetical protein A9762_06050 [Pandoraea sp. ISTKB]